MAQHPKPASFHDPQGSSSITKNGVLFPDPSGKKTPGLYVFSLINKIKRCGAGELAQLLKAAVVLADDVALF